MPVTRRPSGRIDIFAHGGDQALWHIWQVAPNNGWSGWSNRASLGGWIDQIAVESSFRR
ncbi:hypothetical protein [Brevibacillus laterosporus]|uniref:hypothetical protein n=1 Tax=Brevibacillus laterosporus TaxID=1465 RepID=UPI002654EC49|nr:hypothetical protein [Brevibacillus laterosporus]MDN9010469.1 hypothetical protein [Brevibacillus laterosporus]MDO0941622.1 hypothetical protein [Brevibacillus laterosporus]